MGNRCVVPAMESPATVGVVFVKPVANVRIGDSLNGSKKLPLRSSRRAELGGPTARMRLGCEISILFRFLGCGWEKKDERDLRG